MLSTAHLTSKNIHVFIDDGCNSPCPVWCSRLPRDSIYQNHHDLFTRETLDTSLTIYRLIYRALGLRDSCHLTYSSYFLIENLFIHCGCSRNWNAIAESLLRLFFNDWRIEMKRSFFQFLLHPQEINKFSWIFSLSFVAVCHIFLFIYRSCFSRQVRLDIAQWQIKARTRCLNWGAHAININMEPTH